MEAPPRRTRAVSVSTYEATALESVVETPDTKTLVLDVGSNAYLAGQYVTIDPHQFIGLRSFVNYLEQVKGRREAPRAYSMCSAPGERHVAITIKEEVYEAGRTEYPPLLSGFLVHHFRAGDPIVVRGFIGTYTFPDEVAARTDHLLHLVAGSGSVPNFSILKDSLERHPRVRHTFVYSNKTWQDVIFRDALEQLHAEYADRLRVIHTLTREPDPRACGPNVQGGRVSQDLLRELLAGAPNALIYVCGPGITVWERRACAAQGVAPTPRFIESMVSHLEALGVPSARIKLEAFG